MRVLLFAICWRIVDPSQRWLTMNVRFLETFLWVATLKSVSEAAKRLRVSQSVVSMRLAALQRSLDAELYHGTGKAFELTPVGQRVLSKCAAIVSLTGELEDEVRQNLTAPATVNIGVSEIITLSWLPGFMRALNIDPLCAGSSIVGAQHAELTERLRAGELDVAFVAGLVNDPTLENDYICQYDIKWMGDPSVVKERASMDLVELADLPILRAPSTSYRYQQILEYFRSHSVSGSPELQPRNWVGQGFGMVGSAHLASQGIGVAALPVTSFENYIALGQLRVLPIQQAFLPWQIVALSRRSNPSGAVEQVIRCARTAARAFARSSGSPYFKAAEAGQEANS